MGPDMEVSSWTVMGLVFGSVCSITLFSGCVDRLIWACGWTALYKFCSLYLHCHIMLFVFDDRISCFNPKQQNGKKLLCKCMIDESRL